MSNEFIPKTKTIIVQHPPGEAPELNCQGPISHQNVNFGGVTWNITSERNTKASYKVVITCDTHDKLVYAKIVTETLGDSMNVYTRKKDETKIFHPMDNKWDQFVTFCNTASAIPTQLNVELTVENVASSSVLKCEKENMFHFLIKGVKDQSVYFDLDIVKNLSPGLLSWRTRYTKELIIQNMSFEDFMLFADVCYGLQKRLYTDDEKRRIINIYLRYSAPKELLTMTPEIDQFYKTDFLTQSNLRFRHIEQSVDVPKELTKNVDGIGRRTEIVMKKQVCTQELEAKGFKWNVHFYRQKLFNTEYLSIGVICDGGKTPFKTHAKIRVELLGVDGETHSVVFGRENMTHFEATIGCPTFIKWQQFESFGGFVAPSEGDDGHPATFVVEFLDDATVIEEFNGCSDFKLNFEDHDTTRSLNINKDLLAHTCEYFRAKFFGGFKEAKETESTMKDVSYDHFKAILDLIYHNSKLITEETLTTIMACADRFMSSFVIDWVDAGLVIECGEGYGETDLEPDTLVELAHAFPFHLLRELLRLQVLLGSDTEGATIPNYTFE